MFGSWLNSTFFTLPWETTTLPISFTFLIRDRYRWQRLGLWKDHVECSWFDQLQVVWIDLATGPSQHGRRLLQQRRCLLGLDGFEFAFPIQHEKLAVFRRHVFLVDPVIGDLHHPPDLDLLEFRGVLDDFYGHGNPVLVDRPRLFDR